MSQENALLNLHLDSEAAQVFIDANEKGITPKFEIVTRQDDALPPLGHHEKEVFKKAIAITSIFEWISKRSFPEEVEENKAVVLYCLHPDRAKLDFYENPNDIEATVLTSKLSINPDFNAFQINKVDRGFSLEGLEKLVRQYPHCFLKPEDVKDLLKALRNFEIKFELSVQKQDDRQGNTKDLIQTSIDKHKLEIPKTVSLRMPIFVAGPEVTLDLDIEIGRSANNTPEFFFFNIDAEILRRTQAKEIVQGEVDKFKDSFVCLEQE